MSVRFTAYMSANEDAELRKMAEEEGCSVNYLVRTGIRLVLGKDVPRWVTRKLEEASREKAG